MSVRSVLEWFDRWRAEGQPLVLVTVVETEGSTYTKPGHRMLIHGNGQFQGLVSGGCLEGDLAAHARDVLADGRARLLTYDLRDEGEELFGLGIGCNGMFRVLLQPLRPEQGYAPFAVMATRVMGEAAGVSATVIDSDDPALPPGTTLISDAREDDNSALPAGWRDTLGRGCARRSGLRQAECAMEALHGCEARVLYAPLLPLPRLLVLGAGLDAVALVSLARQLGWRVTVADHRPANLQRGDLAAADEVIELRPAELHQHTQLAGYAAAVVMSHHLDSDREYLRALGSSPVAYVGLLGPRARRERLLGELGTAAAALRPRLHAPVGMAIGADSPETIALAILAEIQATLAGPSSDMADGYRHA